MQTENYFNCKKESTPTSDKMDLDNCQTNIGSHPHTYHKENKTKVSINHMTFMADEQKDAQHQSNSILRKVNQKSITHESQKNAHHLPNHFADCFYHEIDNDTDVFLQLCGSRSMLKRSLSHGDRPTRRHENDGQRDYNLIDESRKNDSFLLNMTNDSSKAVNGDEWRLSLDEFTSKRQGSKRKQKEVSKNIRSFYKSQDNLIDQYREIRLDVDDAIVKSDARKNLIQRASVYAKITFFVNFCLLAIKVAAVVLSGSISLISSLIDSCVDLVSGSVIWATSRAIKKTDRYVYPQGRTKLEPIAIVILSVLMAFASVQIVKESFTKISGLASGSSFPPKINWITIGISATTIVVKVVLFLLCRRVPAATVQALALDHRNDVMSNSAAILFGYLGSQEMQVHVHAAGLVYLDPIGAVIISIYIIANWCRICWDQIKILVGHTATKDFISKIIWICMDHHELILKVDTVKAFHCGNSFQVQVDIVLPEAMTVKEAHDITEPLQQKIEALREVERAFVHIDYGTTHHPSVEHKRA